LSPPSCLLVTRRQRRRISSSSTVTATFTDGYAGFLLNAAGSCKRFLVSAIDDTVVKNAARTAAPWLLRLAALASATRRCCRRCRPCRRKTQQALQDKGASCPAVSAPVHGPADASAKTAPGWWIGGRGSRAGTCAKLSPSAERLA